MREKVDNIRTSRRYVKWLLAAACWGGGLAVLFFAGVNGERLRLQIPEFEAIKDYTVRKGHMGAMRYVHRDRSRGGRCVYAVGFEELIKENGRFGIFKTAAYKIARVNGLELKLFRYSCDDDSGAIVSPEWLFAEVAPLVKKRTLTVPACSGDGSAVGIKVRVDGIDLSDLAEIRVNDFDYKVFYDGDLFFAVQSSRAVASYRRPAVILRGHVTIRASDGSKLECNRAKWDVEKGYFKIDGVYVLNRRGEKSSGKGICVDGGLNSIGAKRAKSQPKEEKECLAKLW